MASDDKRAIEDAITTKTVMAKVDMKLLKGDTHIMWIDKMKPIENSLDKIVNSIDVETQRLAFSNLSEAVYSTVKMFNITGLNIYYQYCPMAKGNKGAYWISQTKEIRNPYFGDAMLTCGETKETLI